MRAAPPVFAPPSRRGIPQVNASVRPLVWLAALATLAITPRDAEAVPPRSDRAAARVAERAYARRSIAEVRAARAEARVAEIAPRVPVPPPPRPATVRRMARAGVPLVGQSPLTPRPQLVGPLPAAATLPTRTVVESAPARPAAPAARPAAPPPAAPSTPADVADDGTRSVLTGSQEPAVAPAAREPAGAAITHPPIELLPTPQPQ